MGEAVACTTDQTVLGEGPRWDARRDELLWVDILAGRVYRHRIGNNGDLVPVDRYQVSGTVGAIAPIEGDEGWLLAAERRFLHLSPDGNVRSLTDDVAAVGTRMNDAACDPQGRFWAGTKADQVGGAALYRFDGGGHTEMVRDGMTISNGLDWSPDGATMYLADSGTRIIHAFAFEPESGTISDERDLVEVPKTVGAPDGLTVDTAGDLWVAIWGGWQVRRYSPDGVLRQELPIPAEQTSACAFAGAGLHRLYVTSATEDWSEEQRRSQPGAGLVYRLETDATGLPARPFRPNQAWWATAGNEGDG